MRRLPSLLALALAALALPGASAQGYDGGAGDAVEAVLPHLLGETAGPGAGVEAPTVERPGDLLAAVLLPIRELLVAIGPPVPKIGIDLPDEIVGTPGGCSGSCPPPPTSPPGPGPAPPPSSGGGSSSYAASTPPPPASAAAVDPRAATDTDADAKPAASPCIDTACPDPADLPYTSPPSASEHRSEERQDPADVRRARDLDRDGIADEADSCPIDPNPGQEDGDLDGVGDACDLDRDGDGVAEDGLFADNCPDVPNTDQLDSDGIGPGDACSAPAAQGSPLAPRSRPARAASEDGSFPWWLLAGTLAAAGAGTAYAHRRKAPLLFLLLFSRLTGDDIASQPARSRILREVTAAPGIHFNELARLAECGRSALRHHLRVLQRSGHVRLRASGRYVCIYPSDVQPRHAEGFLKSDLACRVQAIVAGNPGITVAEAARQLDVKYGAAAYHMRRLADAGIVQLHGWPMRAFPGPQGMTAAPFAAPGHAPPARSAYAIGAAFGPPTP